MQSRRVILATGMICVAVCQLALLTQAQQPTPAAPAGDTATIHAETRLVLVDTVVTDKKGNYIRDLEAKDFKVWEDNKEQPIKNFSFEEGNASGKEQKQYIVLFFDNSTMDMGEQMRARDAAGKFIDANAAPNRLIAVVDFGGTVRIAQNFTADAARLKQVVAGLKTSAVSPNAPSVEVASIGAPPISAAPLGMPYLGNAEADFGARSVLLALRSLAKSLGTVPGRKTLVFLTSGFSITPELQSELTAVISTCNHYNVAVYPLDARGLVAGTIAGPQSLLRSPSRPGSGHLRSATLTYSGSTTELYPLKLAYFDPGQRGGSGGGGGGGAGGGGGGGHGGGTGGGSGGGTGGGGGGGRSGGTGGGTTGGGGARTGGSGGTMSPSQMYVAPQYQQPRLIVPEIQNVSDKQQILYQLAEGTGGFVIV
ncbi:MAG TPA: VWA domain-containing protein, partial [Terracidiphilus sp.]